MKDTFIAQFSAYLAGRNLNLGCAKNHLAGAVNLDQSPDVGADVVHDLERGLPFPDASFDCVVGTHVFEHITGLVPLMADIHRVLRPGGHVISVTPYHSSDDAWDSPFHVRGFTESTWHYFNQKLYAQEGHHGYGAHEGLPVSFQVVEMFLVPYPEFLNDPELDFKKKHWRNVIRELHAVLVKA